MDGKVSHFQSKIYKYIDKTYVFNLSLISMTGDKALNEKNIKSLKKLYIVGCMEFYKNRM